MNRSPELRIGIIAVIVVGSIGYRALFGNSDEGVRFSDALVKIFDDSSERLAPFGNCLENYRNGQTVDVARITAEREKLAKSVENDLALLEKIDVPDDELCKELHAACTAYVANLLRLVEKCAEVVDHISKHNPGAPADSEAVGAILAKALAEDGRLFNIAIACQRKMAKKFDFELK